MRWNPFLPLLNPPQYCNFTKNMLCLSFLSHKTCCSLNYEVTNAYHIFFMLNIVQEKSEKRADIFRFKTALSNTASRYSCTNYEKRIPWTKKQPDKQQILEKCMNRVRITTHDLFFSLVIIHHKTRPFPIRLAPYLPTA